jgi:uncharacterized protein (TIGR04255 family)
MAQYDDEEIYPRQPLTDVACEVRFKGDMAVECQRHLFWEKIRGEYPDIYVPFAQEGQAFALQHYKFRNSEKSRTVSVALNSLGYSEPKYSGHKSFIQEFSRLAGIFSETYPGIKHITRIGWRYINVMPYSREGSIVPLTRFVKFDVSLPSAIFQSTTALDFQWNGKCLDGDVTIRLAAAQAKAGSEQEALILDIDFGQTRADMAWKDAQSILEDARSKSRGIFEGLITDDYREYLRGKSL